MSKINILSDAEKKRYSRQISINEFGVATQLRLKSKKILICGLGGLGSIVANYLVVAGVVILLLLIMIALILQILIDRFCIMKIN